MFFHNAASDIAFFAGCFMFEDHSPNFRLCDERPQGVAWRICPWLFPHIFASDFPHNRGVSFVPASSDVRGKGALEMQNFERGF